MKAFEFAADLVKHLITLSTGMIGLTITFSKDVVRSIPEGRPVRFLQYSWVINGISVIFGAWTLMALTGTLGAEGSTPSISGPNVRFPAGMQVVTFLAGLGLTITYGFLSLARRPTDEPPGGNR